MKKYNDDLAMDADLRKPIEDIPAFIKSLREFSEKVKPENKKSSLEILREIRHGKK
jgi:hypothetical protein